MHHRDHITKHCEEFLIPVEISILLPETVMAHISLIKNSTHFQAYLLKDMQKSPQISEAPTSHTKARIGLLGQQEDMTVTVAY